MLKNSPQRLSGLIKVREEIHSFLDDLETFSGWQIDRIFFLGFSQGGTVALDAALHYRKAIGGAITISAEIMDEYITKPDKLPDSASKLPVLMTHGKKDQNVPIEVARKKYNWLVPFTNNKRIELKDYDKGHQMIASQVKDITYLISLTLQ